MTPERKEQLIAECIAQAHAYRHAPFDGDMERSILRTTIRAALDEAADWGEPEPMAWIGPEGQTMQHIIFESWCKVDPRSTLYKPLYAKKEST